METCSIEDCERKVYARGWCAAHWQRNRRYGDPLGGGPMQLPPGTECSVEGCHRGVAARGWCLTHYYRWKRTGDVNPDEPINPKFAGRKGRQAPGVKCAVADCGRNVITQGWCGKHYQRWRSYGDPEAPLRRGVSGSGYRGLNKDGYVVIKHHGCPQILEHRKVMEETLGRELQPGETVHHMNGKRDDNRPENLELWVSTRSGQRVVDLVAFVVERYRSEVLAALAAPVS